MNRTRPITAAMPGSSVPRLRIIALSIAAAMSLSLTGCSQHEIAKPSTQYGSVPTLPAPNQYLLPPMKVLPAGSWKPGELPTVATGLTAAPLATGLMHPRMVYVLPNDDVLVVESNGPKAPVLHPKDLIMGKIKAYGGSSGKGGNRITLIRPARDGAAEVRTIFLDHLNSPFGVALVGNELFVANTDAVMRYPYATGETHIAAPGVKFADLPAGQIDHHWTKSLLASADGSKLYVGVGSNSNITENGMDEELNRAAILELDRQSGAMRIFASGLRNPNSMQWEPTVSGQRSHLPPPLRCR